MKTRCMLLMLLGVFVWELPLVAQETAPTPEQLLDALYEVWHQYGRQPTAAEIDEKGRYPSKHYLQMWETWEQARQALAAHLYQRGLFASLQGDADKAAEYYRKCLEVDPTHAQAQQALTGAVTVDLDKAATERTQFTVEKAGPQAASAYGFFLMYQNRGMEQEARQQYLLARRQKEAYVRAEVERLNQLYNSAVAAFEQKDYKLAQKRFQELSALKSGQIGYEEVYQPHAPDIQRYLTSTQELQTQQRIQAIISRTHNARFALWVNGAYYLPPSGIGLFQAPIKIKLSSSSFWGYDLGIAFRMVPHLWAGINWSLMVNTPVLQEQFLGTTNTPLESGNINAFSVFLQPGVSVSSTVRLYGQGGVARHRINLQEIKTLFATPVSTQETAPGFFLGAGADFWTYPAPYFTLGARLDLKYHIVRTQEAPVSRRRLKLNGLRIGIGLIIVG